MTKFALLTIKDQEESSKSSMNFLKRLLQQAYRTIKRPRLYRYIKEIDFDADTGFNLISLSLQYSIRDFENKGEKLFKAITSFLESHKIDICVVPSDLSNYIPKDQDIFYCFSGEIVFKSLLVLIIKEICNRNYININDMDIAIVQGDKREELLIFARILSSYIRYLTLITNEDCCIEDEISNIYAESGLSIGVTSDIKGGIKNKNFIINLGNLKSYHLDLKYDVNTWIINYGDEEINKSICKNTIINGVEVSLPKNINSKIVGIENINKSYSKLQIIEAYLYLKLNKGNTPWFNVDSINIYESIAEEFKKEGFKIIGFKGRHGMVCV
jgi:hypothetical protein